MNTFFNFIILILAIIMLPNFYEDDMIISLILDFLVIIGISINFLKNILTFINGTYYYDNNRYYSNSYYDNDTFYPTIKHHIKKKFLYRNPTVIVDSKADAEKKCIIHNNRIEIIKNPFDAYKIDDSIKLLEYKPINDIKLPLITNLIKDINNEVNDIVEITNKPRLTINVNKYDTKVSTYKVSKDVIMIVNDEEVNLNRKGVYTTVIDIFKDKKYSTSKICRILKSIKYIDLTTNSINFYINKNELETCDDIPMMEIVSSLRKTMHCENLQVLFIDIKHVNIFDYYLANKAV